MIETGTLPSLGNKKNVNAEGDAKSFSILIGSLIRTKVIYHHTSQKNC